jgi:hypothetical protein
MAGSDDLQHKLEEAIAERDRYHAELIDMRLRAIEKVQSEHEKRIRPLEDGQIKAAAIYSLFAGNSLLSIIALVKIFSV